MFLVQIPYLGETNADDLILRLEIVSNWGLGGSGGAT